TPPRPERGAGGVPAAGEPVRRRQPRDGGARGGPRPAGGGPRCEPAAGRRRRAGSFPEGAMTGGARRRLECGPPVPARLPGGIQGWLVTRYDDVVRLFTHPEVRCNPRYAGAALERALGAAGRERPSLRTSLLT